MDCSFWNFSKEPFPSGGQKNSSQCFCGNILVSLFVERDLSMLPMLILNSWPEGMFPALASQSADITSVSHRARQ